MKLKLLALAGIMTATMGLTACDSKTENVEDKVEDVQEDVQEVQEDLNEVAVEGEPVADAQAAIADADADLAEAQANLPTDPAETDNAVIVDTDAANAADGTDVVVVEEPVAQ